jgi:hypothetical protein
MAAVVQYANLSVAELRANGVPDGVIQYVEAHRVQLQKTLKLQQQWKMGLVKPPGQGQQGPGPGQLGQSGQPGQQQQQQQIPSGSLGQPGQPGQAQQPQLQQSPSVPGPSGSSPQIQEQDRIPSGSGQFHPAQQQQNPSGMQLQQPGSGAGLGFGPGPGLASGQRQRRFPSMPDGNAMVIDPPQFARPASSPIVNGQGQPMQQQQQQQPTKEQVLSANQFVMRIKSDFLGRRELLIFHFGYGV